MPETKVALITGVTGQDGAYLSKLLLDKGYEVWGTYRRLSTPNFWRLQYLEIFDDVNLMSVDLIDASSLLETVRKCSPDELYNLAAQSFVGASFDQPIATAEISGIAVTRILEILKQIKPDCRFYQASTSEMFGGVSEGFQDDNTPFAPHSPYAAAKLYGHWMTKIYREAYDLYATNGILFNHESPLRGLEFVTRKITNTIAQIKLGLKETIELGNIKAKRDWGYAPEYVEGIWKILQHDEPQDFILATGSTYSVEEFLNFAFEAVKLNYKDYIKINDRYFRPLDVNFLCGDPTRAQDVLGWKTKTSLKELITIMVDEDIKRWQMWLDGESFPWDAPLYTSESTILSRGVKRS